MCDNKATWMSKNPSSPKIKVTKSVFSFQAAPESSTKAWKAINAYFKRFSTFTNAETYGCRLREEPWPPCRVFIDRLRGAVCQRQNQGLEIPRALPTRDAHLSGHQYSLSRRVVAQPPYLVPVSVQVQ